MSCEATRKAWASKAIRNDVKRLASIRGIPVQHSDSPRRDFDESADKLESKITMMTQLAVERARAQGKPFRNPFVGKGERLYPVRYPHTT